MYFTLKEFFPNCSQQEINKVFSSTSLAHDFVDLFLTLDLLRRLFGFPIIITSGYRDAEHNKRVGGVDNSWHMQMCAVDIKPKDSRKLQKLVDTIDANHNLFPEVVIHKGYIHLSIKD